VVYSVDGVIRKGNRTAIVLRPKPSIVLLCHCVGAIRQGKDSSPSLEPERLKNRRATTRMIRRWKRLCAGAQAACCFRCSASKRTPFFQTIKVIEAILRARVRRAIDGFIPLASKAA
jgi:hypothetical protein